MVHFKVQINEVKRLKDVRFNNPTQKKLVNNKNLTHLNFRLTISTKKLTRRNVSIVIGWNLVRMLIHVQDLAERN